MVFPPVGLYKNPVDLLQIDLLRAVPDSLEHGTETQVPGPANDPLAGAQDQVECLLSKRIVAQFDAGLTSHLNNQHLG